MGNLRGVKRDFDALEARRLRAASLFKQCESQADVARALGVHRCKRQSKNRPRHAVRAGDAAEEK